MVAARIPKMTWAGVRARRLRRHGLAVPFSGAGPADVVAAMAGTHAQVMPAAELAIGLRLDGATCSDVRAAVRSEPGGHREHGGHGLVRAFGPRGTVHLLPARDLGLWVGALSQLASPPSGFPPEVRLTRDQAGEVVAAIADALGTVASGPGLTIDELSDEVIRRTGPWAGDLVMPAFQGMWPRWRQVLHLAGMRGAVCFGPGRGRKVTYTSPARLLPGFRPAEPGPAVAWIVRRYLHAYGPSTPQRFANWLAIPPARAGEIFASLRDDLQEVDVEGTTAWVTAGDTLVPAEPAAGVRLLPYFDGYSYRVGIQSPEQLYPGAPAGWVRRGSFQNLVVDGVVAGRWQQRRSGRRIAITVEPLITLTAPQRAELDEQAERVGAILEGKAELTIGTVTAGPHA